MPVLADILANADSWKRRVRRNLSDLIDNPAGVMEQWNDSARNRNQNVVPVIQGGSLYNRPMTQEEQQERATQLAMDFMPGGVGMTAKVVTSAPTLPKSVGQIQASAVLPLNRW